MKSTATAILIVIALNTSLAIRNAFADRFIPTTCISDCTRKCKDYAIKKIKEKRKEKSFLGDSVDSYRLLKKCSVYRKYKKGSVYYHPKHGAHEVHGSIFKKWEDFRWERGFLGFPTSDELDTKNKDGKFSRFEGGVIYWKKKSGSHEVHGDIRKKWEKLGAEKGILGYPLTDELGTPDSVGRFNHFEHGSIYWHPKTGAREIHGPIRDRWEKMGWERSKLGYPRTGEEEYMDVKYNRFQNGYIFYHKDYDAKDAEEWFDGRYVYYPKKKMNIDRMSYLIGKAQMSKTVDDGRLKILEVAIDEVKTGIGGNAARKRYGAKKKWCSEFVRWVYRKAGMKDIKKCKTKILGKCVKYKRLTKVKTVADFRTIFKHYGRWHVNSHGEIDSKTINPGDYITTNGKSHSTIALAVSRDKKWVFIAEGNSGNKVNYRAIRYMKDKKVNDEIAAVGTIDPNWL